MSASHMHSLFVLIESVSLPLPWFVFTVTYTGNGKDNVGNGKIINPFNMSIFQKKYVHGLGFFH